MKKLTALAAALAAGMTTFAAHSQEAPGNFGEEFRKAGGQAAAAGKTDQTSMQQEAAKPVISAAGHDGRGMQHLGGPGIDTSKPGTAQAGASRKSPELVATARKKEVLKGVTTTTTTTTTAATATSGGRYQSIVSRYASAYGVPASLAHAVIRIESNYRVNALGRAGEVGLMQIKPSTARGLGYSGSVKALYNPETNIQYGMKYLAMAHKLGGGSTCGTILKYNAGHGAKRMNPVSAAYCSKVKRHLSGS